MKTLVVVLVVIEFILATFIVIGGILIRIERYLKNKQNKRD